MRRPSSKPLSPSPQRQAGRAASASSRPTPGWKGHPTAFANPRLPSVPASLALSLEEYYAAGALMGLLASQTEEPDPKWACQWSHKMGRHMAAEAVKRRRKGRR